MTNRLLVALFVALGFIGSASAQAPDGLPFVPPMSPGDGPVAPACCDGPSGRAPDNWVTADFFLAWVSGIRIPPLLTTSPAGTTTNPGVLPMTPPGNFALVPSTTSTLIGNDWVNQGTRAGFRAAAGYRFCPELCMSVEAGASFIEGMTTNFEQGSDGSVILARPFVNALTGTNAAFVIASPGISSATFQAQVSSGSFYEAHFDFSETLWDDSTCRVDPMLGYRFYRYDEKFTTRQVLTFLPNNPNGDEGQIFTLDDFSTRNTFNGPEIGVRVWFGNADLSLELLGKVALGNLRREVNIKGTTTTVTPGAEPILLPGGFFALPSNSGVQVRNDWASLPELGATLHWRLSPSWRMRIGYTALMLDGVARASEHVNLTINRNQILGTATVPEPNTHAKDMWIQALTLGLEYAF